MARKNDPSRLVFDEQDIRSTSTRALLPLLIRIFMFRHQITNDQYLERYERAYNAAVPEHTRKEFTQKAQSDRKAMVEQQKITFNLLNTIIQAMGFKIEAVSIRVSSKMSGKEWTVSTDDSIEDLKSKIAEDIEINVQSLD
jgi:hypothetical protein